MHEYGHAAHRTYSLVPERGEVGGRANKRLNCRIGKLMRFVADFAQALVEQAEHALLDKPPSLVADSGAIEFGLLTARGDRFGKQDDGTNGFIGQPGATTASALDHDNAHDSLSVLLNR